MILYLPLVRFDCGFQPGKRKGDNSIRFLVISIGQNVNADSSDRIFESRFESANLRKVVKISDSEYDLYLKNDYGTNGFTQWYFFRVQNTRKDKVYRFNIVNFMKPDSNYN